MIETGRLKNFVIFIQIILGFVLSRNTINIYRDIARKYGNVAVKDFGKYEKLEYKKNKLHIDFLNNCKQLGVYPKFHIFKLPNVSNKDTYQFVKDSLLAPLASAIKNNSTVQKNSVYPKTFYLHSFLLQLSTTESLRKSLYNQQKKLSSLTRDCNLPIFIANETIINLTQCELS